LEKGLEELGPITNWQTEYKWDGIRGQIIKRKGEVFIWSRGEELVTQQFPEIGEELMHWQGDFAIDGELLAYKDGEVLHFAALQKRLNRKNLSKKMLEEVPVVLFGYDLLEWEGEDWRQKDLSERRGQLEKIFAENPTNRLLLSPVIAATSWKELEA